uniref:Myb/SANT-like DNA-binding domain containing 4 with coiled-coils n=1 Tax=Nothobranchius korthausae TaxID=1143690 RepID=A0A1A8H698_9TELE
MKKKQLTFEPSPSSSSSLTVKTEYDQSSPEHEAAPQGACEQLGDLSGFPRECQSNWPELVALDESSVMAHPGVKMEDNISEYKVGGDVGDGDIDEDDIPSLLSDIESCGEGPVGDMYSHNDLDLLSSSEDPISTTNRDLLPTESLMGIHGLCCDRKNMDAGFLFAVEKQRLELEKQRLTVETERLAVEKERLLVEKGRLRQAEVEKERLHLERERLQVERERLRLLLLSQSEHVDSPFLLLPQDPPSSSTCSLSSTPDEQEEKSWISVVNLETEKMNLERERLQLEKQRLQLFKFEAGRLQIGRERLQVEKERMHLHKDHQPIKA